MTTRTSIGRWRRRIGAAQAALFLGLPFLTVDGRSALRLDVGAGRLDALGASLAIDEAFDEWEGPKNKWSVGHNVYPPQLFGYFEDFPEWHERDLKAMVLRDRNHPSIILWSIGNEIDYPNDPYCHPSFADMTGNNDANKPAAERKYSPDKPNAERIVTLSKRLASLVKGWDDTRPVTAAMSGLPIEYRETVVLRFQEGLGLEEIATLTKLPLGTVKSRLYRALNMLMGRLKGARP
jgi:hypothetical protein